MSVSHLHPSTRSDGRPADESIFRTVLVGIDETEDSLIAAVQARALCAPGGRLVLLGVAETYLAAQAGPTAVVAEEHLVTAASEALGRARSLVGADEARLVEGRFLAELRAVSAATAATLVAIGVPRHRRISALLFGGRDVEIVHHPPCAVLVAHAGWGRSGPERVLYLAGESSEARRAEAVARAVAERLGCAAGPAGEATERDLVVAAGRDAERVVSAARCSVLALPDRAEAGA